MSLGMMLRLNALFSIHDFDTVLRPSMLSSVFDAQSENVCPKDDDDYVYLQEELLLFKLCLPYEMSVK